METLKRPYNGDADGDIAVKKRVRSSTPGSPHAMTHINGSAKVSKSNEPRDEDDLERFRKVAIFRCMRKHARSNERALKQLEMLEEAKRHADMELVNVEMCWSQFIRTVSLLAGNENRNSVRHQAITDDVDSIIADAFSELRSHSEKNAGLKSLKQQSEKLVDVFLKAVGQVQTSLNEQVLKQLEDLEKERVVSQGECRMLQKANADLVAQKNQLSQDLIAADEKIQRLERETRILKRESSAGATRLSPVLAVKEEREVGPEVSTPKQEHANGTFSLSQATSANQSEQDVHEHYSDILLRRDEHIKSLEDEIALLRDKEIMMMVDLRQIGESIIKDSPVYTILLEHASILQGQVEDAQAEAMNCRAQLSRLKQEHTDFETMNNDAGAKEAAETKSMLKKRDEDLTRLRHERFNWESKALEQKAKLESTSASLREIKALCSSHEERSKVLSSEVQRLRIRLAGQVVDDDILNFIFRDSEIKLDYVEDLRGRLKETERQLDAARGIDVQAVRSGKLDLMKELGEAKKQLAEIEAKYGTNLDVVGLRQQLDLKDDELRSASVRESHLNQQLEALMNEVDRLSVSWESLNEQIQNSDKGLRSWEEERDKIYAQKAKTDHNYYKLKKELEVKEIEGKQAARNVEKQLRTIDSLVKSERVLQQNSSKLEAEIEELKKVMILYQNTNTRVEREIQEVEERFQAEVKRTDNVRSEASLREKTIASSQREIMKLKDSLAKAERDLERAKQTATVKVAVGSASEREEALQKEISKYSDLLKCSTCRNDFRSRIITKCMHTFCKGCVDARIHHRSRKCPACNIPFSQADVQTLYLQ